MSSWKPEETLEDQVAGGAERLRDALGIPADMQLNNARQRFTAKPEVVATYGWQASATTGPINGLTGFDITRRDDGTLIVELLGRDGVVLATIRYTMSDRLDSVADSVAAPVTFEFVEGSE